MMSVALLNIVPEEIKERRYDRPNFPDPALGAIFSYLKKNNIKCNILDSKLERLSLTKIIERLMYIKPHIIGFTSVTHEIERVAYAAYVIKNQFPKAKLIIGGSHANALPGEVLSEFPVFDISVFGEGEETIVDLVRSNCDNLEKIPGIAYRKGKDIVVNKSRAFLDMENLPIIRWEGFPKARYYPVFTSRGCAYKCIFCSRPWGSKVRYRSIQNIIEEIREIEELYRPKVIYFWDENFCADREKVFGLLERIRGNKITKNIKWFCQTHINDLDYELLKLMKESGCIRMGIGIESGNERMLRKIDKGTTKKRICQVVSWLKEIKIPIEGYFLFGLPDECWQTAMDTIKFAVELNPKYPVFGIVAPYPGTEIYSMAMRGEGGYRIISRKWKDYGKIIGRAIELNALSRKQLEILQLYGYASVLVKNFRFFDIIRFIFQYYKDIGSYITNSFSTL